MGTENIYKKILRYFHPGYTNLRLSYRLSNIAKAYSKLYFIIILLLLGFAAFFFVPQGQDMMFVALANGLRGNGFFSLLAISYWAVQCYLGARIILTFSDFTISDKQLEEIKEKEINRNHVKPEDADVWIKKFKDEYIDHFKGIQTEVPKWFFGMPYLIVLAAFIKACCYYSSSIFWESYLIIVLVLAVGLFLFFTILKISKSWIAVAQKCQKKFPKIFKDKITPEDIREVKVHKLKDFSELKQRERNFYYGSLIISLLSILAFCFLPVSAMQCAGAIAIISFGFACWLAISYMMSYVDINYLWPVKLSFFIAAIVFSYWDYDHPVNTIDKKSGDYKRETVDVYFKKWLQSKGTVSNNNDSLVINGTTYTAQNKFPVVMIAAEGGASRSGFWVAKVLAHLHDSLLKDSIYFNNHIFSFSSVSGGSLGSGVYYALMQHDTMMQHDSNYEKRVDAFFKEDMLAPIAGRLFFPEIAHVFLPFTITPFDRVTALEETWNYVWNTTSNNNDNYFKKGFLENTFDASGEKPVWCINSTWTEYGNRAIVSNIKIDTASFIYSSDVLDSAGTDLPYATAISVSARFPFISPAGHVLRNDSSIGHLVDGGYYENKGALTTYDMVRTINNKSKFRKLISITIILITNDGEFAQTDTARNPIFKSKYYKPETLRALNELYEPLASLYKVRSGHTQYAEDILMSLNTADTLYDNYLFNDSSCKPVETTCYKIDLGLNGKTVPLNWNISKLTKDTINHYLSANPKNKMQMDSLITRLKRK